MTKPNSMTYIDRAKAIVEARVRLQSQLKLSHEYGDESVAFTRSLRDAVMLALQHQGRSKFALTIWGLLPMDRAPDAHELWVIYELENALFGQRKDLEEHIIEVMFSTRT